MAIHPRDVLEANRLSARQLVERAGKARARKVLERAERDLARRLHDAVKAPGAGTYTHEQVRASLRQVRIVLKGVKAGIRDEVKDAAREAAELAADGTLRYMRVADKAFRGLGSTPLALDEAAVLDSAVSGAQASVLRRLASSGEPVANADAEPHPAKQGILDRYGISTVEKFEDILQNGILTKKPWAEMRAEITAESPFLQGSPAYFAERIVRTELAGAYNRAGFEAIREADDQLGDMVKIVLATFDDRTGCDSWNVSGMVRRPEEAFEYVTWDGEKVLYQTPPNRPNDRECVVPHRLSWGRPRGNLLPKSSGAVEAEYAKQKKQFFGRPTLTTLDVDWGELYR